MKKVFIDCTAELRTVIIEQGLRIPDGMEICDGSFDSRQISEWCKGASVVLVEHTSIPDDVLVNNTSLREIVFMGTGAASYINLDLARSAGIAVSTVSGYGDRAVAEHTIALMFSGARRVADMDRAIRDGNWNPLSGIQLQDKRLAVIGLGGVGTAVGRLAESIGMQVQGWNATERDVSFYCPDVRQVLKDADVVTIHLALNEQTRGLLDYELLSLPKAGFLLVNTARAALLDALAFREGLISGQIGYASLDVFDEEPLPSDDWLRSRPNVTMTAHAAYMTTEAYSSLWRKTLEHVDRIDSSDK
ncbi:NAD(P)-dependent oxidoreductase [Burkholderia cepacia]|uniref:NAD(P)-dependent oxidoreductase n=1 Tax=Burkholderia cepacia TaxID=292 RepID=UPI0007C804AD|nr:NAD(P)-dependent oxidoreductase [Burkholderia cepacia]